MSNLCIFVKPKIKTLWRIWFQSKNDPKSPLRALNKELWAIYVFSSNLKVHDFQKHQRKQPKIKTLWRIEFQPQKYPKNATWKKEFKARLEALIYSFDVFSMFFNTNKLVVRVDEWWSKVPLAKYKQYVLNLNMASKILCCC